MTLDLTSFDAALKQHYTNDRVENLIYPDNPFFALIPKMENFGGRNLPIPLIYGNPQGRSATFATAQTRGGTTSSQLTDFVLTRVKDYSIATIDNETLEASKGNVNAFVEAATTEIDGAIQSLTRSVAVKLFRDSSGQIGQVLAEPTVANPFSLTMKLADDITNVEVGQVHLIFSAKAGGSQRDSDGTDVDFVVTGVDRDAGIVSYSAEYDSNGDIAADDFIFNDGDRGLALSGLEDWLPAAAPSATLFFGVDRTADTTRLGGHRQNGANKPIEEALIDGAVRTSRSGLGIDHYFISFEKYGDLEKALGSKVQYVDLMATADIGFRGIQINGPKGPVKVVPDQNCPSDRAFGLKLSMWKLYSLGKAVRVIDTDGLQMLRQASSDGVEVRYGGYMQLGSRGPGYGINVQL